MSGSTIDSPMEHHLRPLARVGLVDQAYGVIRSAIINQEFKPGTTLTTIDVSEKLGVSRTPVRQALLLLARQGLLDTDNRGQFVVHTISDDEAVEIFLVRASLESLAARKLTLTLSDSQYEELSQLIHRQEIARDDGDSRTFLQSDQEFHVAIARFASLPLVMEHLEGLRDKVRVIGGQAIARPGRLGSVLHEHRAILNALRQRNASDAVAKVAEHLVNTAHSVGTAIDEVIWTAVGPLERGDRE